MELEREASNAEPVAPSRRAFFAAAGAFEVGASVSLLVRPAAAHVTDRTRPSTIIPAADWMNAQKSHKVLDGTSPKLVATEPSGGDRDFMCFGANVTDS